MYSHDEVREKTLEYFNNDELATNVFITKYCLKDKDGLFRELTPDDMHRRLSKEFARIEAKFGGSSSLDEDDIYSYLKDFKYIVPQGSPMMGIGNDFINVSLSNCVVVGSPEDNISSIIDAGKDMANLFKRRCGVGLDISKLRPEGSFVNNSAGTTTGAWSFSDFYSYICRMIGQNGRRGALMLTMDIRHPDIEKFINMKRDLSKVTGANVSVRITDDFMNAVNNDESYTLHFPCGSESPVLTKEIIAKDLWRSIVESATETAEPGLLMWDNITKYLPANEYSEYGFKTVCTNPCAEIPLSEYDSCRLISVNLKHFVINAFEDNAYFDFDKFSNVARAAMRLSDDLVELEIEKLNSIILSADTEDEVVLWGKLLKACTDGRRTGLGTHGLADVLARLNMPYDSDDAIEAVEKLYSIYKNISYDESSNLASERGSFDVFDWDVECDNLFIKGLDGDVIEKISKFGRRNISILTNAPTGSVSIMSQTSSGLEPVFRNSYVRRRKISHNESDVEPDFIDKLGDRWLEFDVFHHNVEEYLSLKFNDNMYTKDDIPSFFTESNDIDWIKRIEMQEAIQKNIDHAISSTINLPKGTPSDVIAELYMEGWRRGLKGITVYVDGSRDGVLISKEDGGSEDSPFPQIAAPKRPEVLDCNIHHATIGGEKWTILVGTYEGKPYEIMGGLATFVEIPKKYRVGIITKHPRKSMNSIYDLQFGENGSEVIVKNIVKVFDNPNQGAFTRMISLALRHGASINYVVEQLRKDKESDMFSLSRCIARVLKQYIKDGTRVSGGEACLSCNGKNLIYQDGCVNCQDCGWAGCG
jgi:ribonucleoside-diphosphate reductase alpha chain